MENVSLTNLSPSQLRRAAEVKEQIDALNEELGRILSGGEVSGGRTLVPSASGGRRPMSAAGKAKIAAAARARWAKFRAQNGGTPSANGNGSSTPKRTMSPAAKKRIAEAQKARWAKLKAAKGKS